LPICYDKLSTTIYTNATIQMAENVLIYGSDTAFQVFHHSTGKDSQFQEQFDHFH